MSEDSLSSDTGAIFIYIHFTYITHIISYIVQIAPTCVHIVHQVGVLFIFTSYTKYSSKLNDEIKDKEIYKEIYDGI